MKHGRASQCLTYIYLLFICGFLLSGCLPGFMQPKTDYRIAGLEGNAALKKEMDDFIAERADNIDTKTKSEKYKTAREERQREILRQAVKDKMESEGYYDASVVFTAGAKDWTGTYKVEPGTRYKIRKVTVEPKEFAALIQAKLAGKPLDAAAVLEAQEKLYEAAAKDKCWFNLSVDHEAFLDLKAKAADITFTVTAGPPATFGAALFTGNKDVKSSYLHKLVGWKKGDCYKAKRIEELRTALFGSGLFSGVEITLPKQPGKDGAVPVTVEVKERAFRTISAGVSYYTGEGPGLTLGWKHRNLFGAAELLDTKLKLSNQLTRLEGTLTKPFFLRKDQTLSFNASAGQETTDTYEETSVDAGAALKRVFSKTLSGSTGLSLSYNVIDDHTLKEKNEFYLISLPQTIKHDSRDNVLNATKGLVLEGKLEPFFDAGGQTPPFLKSEGTVQAYHGFNDSFTLAGRLRLGSILGPATATIPATKRFFAGGGGSVRGFGYQEIGPQLGGQPEGGRSLVETSAELRFKASDTIGIVGFVDAGNVSTNPVIAFDDLSVGAGLGLRYFTGFGPLRLDVAVPVNHKDTASAGYQFYLSIGQAF